MSVAKIIIAFALLGIAEAGKCHQGTKVTPAPAGGAANSCPSTGAAAVECAGGLKCMAVSYTFGETSTKSIVCGNDQMADAAKTAANTAGALLTPAVEVTNWSKAECGGGEADCSCAPAKPASASRAIASAFAGLLLAVAVVA